MTKTSFYIDMDGVLVLYGVNDYTGPDPVWLKKNTHYFKNLQPDKKMLSFADALYRYCQSTGDEMYILTSLSTTNGAIFNEHMHDKILWLRQWLPYVDIENILISTTTKRDIVEYLHGHTLTCNDILIDDYNKNLNQWNDYGGTAIKYCNGINSPDSYQGTKMYYSEPVLKMLEVIDSIKIANAIKQSKG